MELIHHLMELLHSLGQYEFWNSLVHEYGTLAYLVFFLIIFAETGFVITPFLPGDSLLFAAGMVTAVGDLNIVVLIIVLLIAALAGNTVNFFIGKAIGPAIFEKERIRFIKKKHLNAAHEYYEKHGSRAVILARFVPFIRTFVPFVAGIAQMDTRKYLLYTFIGAFCWVLPFTIAGYLLASNEWVKVHFSQISLSIVVITLIPLAWSFIRDFMGKKHSGE